MLPTRAAFQKSRNRAGAMGKLGLPVVAASSGPARRRGMMLVLVVFFLFLAGVLSALATANAMQLARTTRHYHEAIMLRQMTDSAHAWLVAQPDWRSVVPAVLDMKDLVPEGAAGIVRVRSDETDRDLVVIEATFTTNHRKQQRTTGFNMPSK